MVERFLAEAAGSPWTDQAALLIGIACLVSILFYEAGEFARRRGWW